MPDSLSGLDGATDKRTIKSGKTKRKILDATLDLIAEHGLSYVSHRHIAKRAGVRLSLTSYHFGTLDKLIEAAFDSFDEQSLSNQKQLMHLIEGVYTHCRECSSSEEFTDAYIDTLVKRYADYFEANLKSSQASHRVENHFIHALNLDEVIESKVEAFNRRVQNIVEIVCSHIGSEHPSIDAFIIIATLRRIELDHAYSLEDFDRELFDARLKRLLTNAAAS